MSEGAKEFNTKSAMKVFGHFERHIKKYRRYLGDWWIGLSTDHEAAYETVSAIEGAAAFTEHECEDNPAMAAEVVRCLEEKYGVIRVPDSSSQGSCLYLFAHHIPKR